MLLNSSLWTYFLKYAVNFYAEQLCTCAAPRHLACFGRERQATGSVTSNLIPRPAARLSAGLEMPMATPWCDRRIPSDLWCLDRSSSSPIPICWCDYFIPCPWPCRLTGEGRFVIAPKAESKRKSGQRRLIPDATAPIGRGSSLRPVNSSHLKPRKHKKNITSNVSIHTWSTKWSLFIKLFVWIGCKSRDESNEPT